MMKMLDEEIDGKKYFFTYAFSIDVKFEDCFNRYIPIGNYVGIKLGIVGRGLKDEFKANKSSFSERAQVTKVEGKENGWVIKDRVNTIVNTMYRCPPEVDIIMFLVRKEDGKLNIYKGTEKEGEEKKRVSNEKKENAPSREYRVIKKLIDETPKAKQQSEHTYQHVSYQYR